MTLNFSFNDSYTNFAVDEAERTITGLAVPYGPEARNGGRKWVFQKGSLNLPEAANVSRIKLLLDHVHSSPIGKALSLTETDEGLVATFKVARTPAGDLALTEAADGIRDGLSVGLEMPNGAASFEQLDTGASRVKVGGANLMEITLTAMPAFTEARISHVGAFAADNQEGTNMDENTSSVDTDAITEAIKAGFATAPRPTAATVVNEGPVYRFDGGKGKYDFSTDIFAGHNGDHEAQSRVEGFLANFQVVQSDVASLNPATQRPDMYVDQRKFEYPLWDRVKRGTINDNTPFILPKFSTASGLVGPHTEGVEPSAGAFTATSQTVTPTAVAGYVNLTQEVIDAGGSPQVSQLIWAKMTDAYNEALEASVVTALNAVSPTAITITAGAVDAALQDELVAALAALQFVRGGFRFDTLALQADLYLNLAKAKDADGRKLFPILGATNAVGTSALLWGTINVGGLVGIPTWALAAAGQTSATPSYLFDRFAVNGWASAPKRIDWRNELSSINIGIFGYKVVAVTDLAGVRKINYDPTA